MIYKIIHYWIGIFYKTLKIEAATMKSVTPKVCHGEDIYQKNWLLSDQNSVLYLVDWDSFAMLADPQWIKYVALSNVQREIGLIGL